jgi:hypothetical protein
MPIPKGTQLTAIQGMLAANISAYNSPGTYTEGYNHDYNRYVVGRAAGISAAESPAAWIANSEAASSIRALLKRFGMNARNSELVALHALQGTLAAISPETINWVFGISLPLDMPPQALMNPATGATLSAELAGIYEALATPGSITISGGYVAASKAIHCLFPELAPMIDGQHTGISYYNIDRATYTPPLRLDSWERWVGAPIEGVPNPSPRGAGRKLWGWQQFMAAIGINQHIYELWQAVNGNPGYSAFLALDPTPGTTGIPRIIDKGLW